MAIMNRRLDKSGTAKAKFGLSGLAALALIAPLAGCIGYDGTVQRGFQADERLLGQLKPGLSKEKVLSTLGSPSTTSTVGGDAWYYISQRVERKVAFMTPSITDQRVLAVYFSGGKVSRIGSYGLQDGQVFDYVTRTTAVAGGDTPFLQNMLTNLLKF
jgi:outer membrane protein assembly factor BamE (lipoprotein component of BamABCDE complex)